MLCMPPLVHLHVQPPTGVEPQLSQQLRLRTRNISLNSPNSFQLVPLFQISNRKTIHSLEFSPWIHFSSACLVCRPTQPTLHKIVVQSFCPDCTTTILTHLSAPTICCSGPCCVINPQWLLSPLGVALQLFCHMDH